MEVLGEDKKDGTTNDLCNHNKKEIGNNENDKNHCDDEKGFSNEDTIIL